ncbi:MAG: response regulator [Armatimonadetes bacterium]|nr:response regulator [Armatimonadota bacterium]
MRILLADDSLLSRERQSQVLAGLGHVVVQARDGGEAVNKYKTDEPDIVITDLDMPNMNGIEAIRMIRRHDPDASILVCTSSTDEEQLSAVFRLGVSEILPKPMDPGRLQTALSRIAAHHAHR